MRITAVGSTLTMHRNGVEVVRVTNATAATSGAIGLVTEGGNIYIDNLRITSFD